MFKSYYSRMPSLLLLLYVVVHCTDNLICLNCNLTVWGKTVDGGAHASTNDAACAKE